MKNRKSKKNNKTGYGLNGYMTTEASVIIPLAFVCFIIIILYTFYLYNHLTVYQSCYLSALRGSQLKNATNGAVKAYVDRELEKLLDEQVYEYQIDYASDVSMISIKVKAGSYVDNLMARFGLYTEKKLTSSREVAINRIDPVDYIRNAERF